MSQFRQMQVFAAVAQAGSLAAAARQLEQSQATIMRSVAALEARLGTTLLVRSPRGVSLSASGEHFAASCLQILEQVHEAERSAAGLHGHLAGPLTVSLPLLMTHQVFMAIATDYLDAFTDVAMLTIAHEGVPKLLEDGIDVGLVVGRLPDSSEFSVSIGRVRPVICASPAYLAQFGRPTCIEELRGHRTILASAAGHGLDWRLFGPTATRSIRTAPALTCTTQQGAIQAAVSGLGLIRCLSYEAHQELQAGQLVPVLEGLAGANVPAQLIYREGRRASGRVRAFIDFAAPRLRLHPVFCD